MLDQCQSGAGAGRVDEACGSDVRRQLTGGFNPMWALVGVVSERLLRRQKLHPSLVTWPLFGLLQLGRFYRQSRNPCRWT